MLRPTSRTDVLKQHEKLFREELGRLEGQEVHVSVKEEAQPRFSKARQVPFALKAKVESELHAASGKHRSSGKGDVLTVGFSYCAGGEKFW